VQSSAPMPCWSGASDLLAASYDEWLGWAVWWVAATVLFISVKQRAPLLPVFVLMPRPARAAQPAHAAVLRNDRSSYLP